MSFLKRLLTFFRYIIGYKPDEASTSFVYKAVEEKPLIGTNGPIDADILVMKEDDRVIIVVDHDFLDVPEWVEWDVSRNVFGVVQLGGAVAEMKNVIPPEKADMFKNCQNTYLSTRFAGKHIVHAIRLVVRE